MQSGMASNLSMTASGSKVRVERLIENPDRRTAETNPREIMQVTFILAMAKIREVRGSLTGKCISISSRTVIFKYYVP